MPNVLAHNYVTHVVMRVPSPNLALGSVLPDFAHMYRDYEGEKVDIKGHNPTVDLGVYFHRKTDREFVMQPETPQVTTDLTSAIEESGIKPGAARLSAHFLADVMLDGALLDRQEPRGAYAALTEYILEGETELHEGDFPIKFRDFVEEYFEEGVPIYYNDPQRLAQIVQHRLDKRARTEEDWQRRTINPKQLPALAEVIDKQADMVHRLGMTALSRTIKILETSMDIT